MKFSIVTEYSYSKSECVADVATVVLPYTIRTAMLEWTCQLCKESLPDSVMQILKSWL